MSESHYDSANEYTSQMDDHVAELRTDNLILDNDRWRGRSRSANEEVENEVPEVHIEASGTTRSNRCVYSISSSNNQNRLRHYSEEGVELEYGATHVIKFFVPVSLCMLVMVATISSVNFYTTKGMYLSNFPFKDVSEEVLQVTLLIIIIIIMFMTVIHILNYKYRFFKVKNDYMMTSLMLLSVSSVICSEEMMNYNSIPMDYFTLSIGLWNLIAVGLICIYSEGPLQLQQAYLIFISAVTSFLYIKYFPEWITWVVLGVISILDLIAVFDPKALRRKPLIETAKEQNGRTKKQTYSPLRIYSSTVLYSAVIYAGYVQAATMASGDTAASATRDQADNQNTRASGDTEEGGSTSEWIEMDDELLLLKSCAQEVENSSALRENARQQENRSRESQEQAAVAKEECGVKLGLSDFIFYSILVGKASSYGDWNTTLACFVAILIGLCLTLLLLAIFKKALPALPISLTFGLTFYFATSVIVAPFADSLANEQVFI